LFDFIGFINFPVRIIFKRKTMQSVFIGF